MQLAATLSTPSLNHSMRKSSSSNDQSPALVGAVTQSSRFACSSQKPSGSPMLARYIAS